jgi:hypothetical protein
MNRLDWRVVIGLVVGTGLAAIAVSLLAVAGRG